MTIDVRNITNFNRTKNELELFAIFCILVAGKNAQVTARQLNSLLTYMCKLYYGNSVVNPTTRSPFALMRLFSAPSLALLLKSQGIGCYTSKSKALHQLVTSHIDLTKCSIEDLEHIHGIGSKTARMFILHSRQDSQCAVLDTHVLKYLRSRGIRAPKQTPTGAAYKRLETAFIDLARKARKSVAAFDLSIWRKYTQDGGMTLRATS